MEAFNPDEPMDPRVHDCLLAQFRLGPLPAGMSESDFYARVAELQGIVQACAFARRPEAATVFAEQGLSLAQARIALCNMLADADEATAIDTASPVSKSLSDVWAARAAGLQQCPGADLQAVWKNRGGDVTP